MNKQEFLTAVEKLSKTDLFSVAKKGAHYGYLLGYSVIGSTTRQNEKIWKVYGSLSNIIVLRKADEVNAILKDLGIEQMKAVRTKSGEWCRIKNV